MSEDPPTKVEPILRSIPMPSDTIAENYVSAGWILSHMDLAGGKYAYNYTKDRTVTVALNAMSFHQPIYVSDEISFYGEYIKIGRTSLTIGIEAWAHRRFTDERIKVTEAVFTFVHTNQNREPIPIEKREDIPLSGRDIPKSKHQHQSNQKIVINRSEYKELLSTDRHLALRTVPLPRDTNYLGDIFGGWILSQMDLAGLLQAGNASKNRIVTVGIEDMTFHYPVFIGDQVSFLTRVVRTGKTSITVQVESYVFRNNKEIYEKVTEGLFTYVAIDHERKPVEIRL